MKCPYVIKVCTKCKRILVANTINFKKAKKGKYKLYTICKMCNKNYYEENKKDILEKQKEYYENHKDKVKEYQKEYCDNHKDKVKEYKKEYYERNKEDILKKQREYHKDNPHIAFNNRNKRRLKEDEQGIGINKEQWYEMMNFFDWCCAYSGKYIGGSSEQRTVDHIIPLSLGGGHEIWNCVPMYANYNYSKYTSDMLDWYIEQDFFDVDRLLKIYEWIEFAYNKYANNNINN